MARFFAAKQFAVVGASTDPLKFGFKVLKWYQQRGLPVIPIHPKELEIEGLKTYPSIKDIPDLKPEELSISIITPPKISQSVVKDALALGVNAIWLQPGAEDDGVRQIVQSEKAQEKVTLGGPCILVLGQGLLDEERKINPGRL
ncbi:NAD(P)-binding protein [Meredithblackwellia eburnea MCA 4105]